MTLVDLVLALVKLGILKCNGDVDRQSMEHCLVGAGEGGFANLVAGDQYAHEFAARCQRGGDNLFGWQVEISLLRFRVQPFGGRRVFKSQLFG